MSDPKIPSKLELVELFNDLVSKYSKDKSIVLTDETDVKEIGIDSIDIMEIVFEIEEKYSVEVDDVSTLQADTFGELVDSLHKNLVVGA